MEGIRCPGGAHQVRTLPAKTLNDLLTSHRVFTWIFLLDTAFVIFNNLPPRLVIKEMKMHMATPEACFQATSADECHQQIQLHLPVDSAYWSLSFRGAFESLSKDTFSPVMCQAIADLGPLNLFSLTSGEWRDGETSDIRVANCLLSSHSLANLPISQLSERLAESQAHPQHPHQLARRLAIIRDYFCSRYIAAHYRE